LDADRKFAHDMKNLMGIIIGYTDLVLGDMPSDDPKRPDIDEIRKAGENAITLLNDWDARQRRS
jgi:two-component system cell cycle sensor histidine kinase/response regulator CckA